MKKVLFCLSIFLFATGIYTANAQSIIDADEDHNFNDFYKKDQVLGREAMPYAYLREADVVWEHLVWRTIDFREKFNQFFYFPTDPKKDTQGRKNLCNVLMEAWERGDIEGYETDDMFSSNVVDYQTTLSRMTRSDTMIVYEYDEYGDETASHSQVVTDDFKPGEVYSLKIKEAWYIDKQDTRQKVRILAFALVYNFCRDRGEDGRVCEPVEICWFPMNDMRVRNVLVKALAYDEHNTHAERSYDDIFIDRYFDSFCTRESNVMNRKIQDYLTGTDAIIESQRIEDEIWNIESDMWEY